MPPLPDAHKAVLAQLLAEDAELQGVARDYLVLGLRESIDLLRRGPVEIRASIARSLIPVLTRALTDVEPGEDEQGDLRAEMHEMIAGVRGEIMGEQEEDQPTTRVMVAKS